MPKTIVRPYDDMDFLGFSFCGIHSSDLRIIRTSNGSRYNMPINGETKNETVTPDGLNVTYLFSSVTVQRTFSIAFAFDNLTEEYIRKIKDTFNPQKEGELIFDEEPYKAYTAKLNGNITLQVVPFYNGLERIFKGEGTIGFICYNPYGHTPKETKTVEINGTEKLVDGRYQAYYSDEFGDNPQWRDVANLIQDNENFTPGTNRGEIPSPFVFSLNDSENDRYVWKKNSQIVVGNLWIKLLEDDITELKWTSANGLVEGKTKNGQFRAINYTGISQGTLPIKKNWVYDNYIMCKDSDNKEIQGIKDKINLDYQFWYY